MAVLNITYNEYFYTAFYLGCLSAISLSFYSMAFETIELMATDVHCMVYDYAIGM